MAAIQVRNVPDALHQRLRERARGENMTLGAFILRVLEREVEKPQTIEEWFERYKDDEPIDLGDVDVVELIHEGRAERDEHIERALRR